MAKKRVLSGIKATGRLHLGNYLGAIKGMLELQNSGEYETFYMVADMHTLTTPYNIDELRENRMQVVLDYLAAGLDPQKSVIFEQSDSLSGELSFYLSSVVTVARLSHLPTYKDKIKQFPENSSVALLNYPVLMAADILAYKAQAVPVGDDQLPHLEVTREIARKMNEAYGLDFPEPEQFKTEGSYVPSLTGMGKMSKSVEGSYINLTDDLETIRAKLAKVPTDSGKGSDIKSPGTDGVVALLTLVGLFEGKEKADTYLKQRETTGVKYQQVKEELAEAIYGVLQPLQERRSEFEANPHQVREIILEGGARAKSICRQTLNQVREAMGLFTK